ncbi:DNA binding protein [Streptomyces phage Zuko]|uniref:Helix-turn-helix DNA binding domain protein n=1 Tax=Streptomyces phage Zuko TaxID=2601695 RepID=A0A5J6D6Z6_9CAUD|nr:DNA binding protein [Streptomyces phage Zuko]QEQ93648.1 DNA binding protein [Streptomyces phage Zuko]
MATLPLPGSKPVPLTSATPPSGLDANGVPLEPDEVGYVTRKPMPLKPTHTPDTCTAEHCSCHLPSVFSPSNLELTGREALVLAWHLFPLNDDSDEELSFEDIGKKLGVRPERARQIYQRAAAKIRAFPRAAYPPRPGTPEYEKNMAAAQEYKGDHPEYAANRALLDAMDMTLTDGADSQ